MSRTNNYRVQNITLHPHAPNRCHSETITTHQIYEIWEFQEHVQVISYQHSHYAGTKSPILLKINNYSSYLNTTSLPRRHEEVQKDTNSGEKKQKQKQKKKQKNKKTKKKIALHFSFRNTKSPSYKI